MFLCTFLDRLKAGKVLRNAEKEGTEGGSTSTSILPKWESGMALLVVLHFFVSFAGELLLNVAPYKEIGVR